MSRFRAYVVARSLRIFGVVSTAFPELALFSPSAELDDEPLEDTPALGLWERLGLDGLQDVTEEDVIEAAGARSAIEVDRFASVLALAERAGLAGELRTIVATALELGLAARPRQASVMIAPAANRTRMLFTVWPQPSATGGRLSIYRWAAAISEFFPSVDEEEARWALGPDGYGSLEGDEVPGFLTRLRRLLGDAVGERPGLALSGEDIRRIAHGWLRVVDPERQGRHYYEIAGTVGLQGSIGGTDQMKTVLTAIKSHGELFTATAPGTYTWVATAQAGMGPSSRVIRYWAMRTDRARREDLWAELQAGRLRQGWG
jgi:hypothetical protein